MHELHVHGMSTPFVVKRILNFIGAHYTPMLKVVVRSDGESTRKNNKIKPQETRGFNVENPFNAKEKNHGR